MTRGEYNKHMTLVLGHRKFTTDKPLAQISDTLPLTSDLGRIIIYCIHLIVLVYH